VAAKEIVDSFSHESGDIEFVERCAKVLPTRMFGDMFGVPEELRELTRKSAGDAVAWADPEALGDRSPNEVQIEACTNLHGVAKELINARRATPTDDLLSNLVQAEIDGERLTDFEIGSFFVLLAVAGTDTTKHVSAFAVKAMTEFPDQRDWLRADFDGRIKTSIEEFIRYASPVMTFRRTAVAETELGGKKIIPGDKVVLFYPSGNYDAEVFADPDRFDLSRDPNPHFCLGNQLAKSMLRSLFFELLTRIPDFEAGEPELLVSNFMRGVKRMKFHFTPEK
jgi:cytochrome P450